MAEQDIWKDVRVMLEKEIEVYYTKRNEELNRKREADKEKTIKWLIKRLKKGPVAGGLRNSRDDGLPQYTWTFGDSALWNVEKKAIKMIQPVCALCGVNPTTEIHHIRPKHLQGRPLDPCNLIGLCENCHDEVHRRIDSGIQSVLNDSLDIPLSKNQKTLEGF